MGHLRTSYAEGSYRASEQSLVVVERLYKPDATRRGVIVGNGNAARPSGVGALPGGIGTGIEELARLAEAGRYPVLFPELGVGNVAWGNDSAVAAMTDAWSFLKAQTGCRTDKVYLAGGSMGALATLNWARANPTLVAGVGLNIPALDLDDIYQNNKGGLRAQIGSAYGVTHPTALPGLATHSPVAYPADVTGFPIRLWTSDDDAIASTTAVAEAWAADVNTAGGNVTVSSLGAVGHTMGAKGPVELLAWLDSIGGRA